MDQAIADTSVLAAFSAINRLDILRRVCGTILVVPAVYYEIVTNGSGWAEVAAVQSAIVEGNGFLAVVPSALEGGHSPPISLDDGETEVIRYAAISGIPALIEDSEARRAAAMMNLTFVGSLGILKRAKELGCIDEVKPCVSGMVEAGIYYSKQLIEDFLEAIGEK